jgi:hypothetical protein
MAFLWDMALFIVDEEYGRFREPATSILKVYEYRGADKSLTRQGRKQATATEDFEIHISYL